MSEINTSAVCFSSKLTTAGVGLGNLSRRKVCWVGLSHGQMEKTRKGCRNWRCSWRERTKRFHQSTQMATTAFSSPQIPLPFARAEVVLTGDVNRLPCWHQLSCCKLGQSPLTPLQSHGIIKDSLKRTRPSRPILLLKDAATDHSCHVRLPWARTPLLQQFCTTCRHSLLQHPPPWLMTDLYHPVFQEPLLYK